jgi:hypothetical protein
MVKATFTAFGTRGRFVCNSMARKPFLATGGCDMRLETKPTDVRSAVVGMFERFGASPQNVFDIKEAILTNKGEQTARTYRVDGLMAMWLMDIGIVQFYDADGNMLATINLLEAAVPQRMAA